jgi:hypothetical protein
LRAVWLGLLVLAACHEVGSTGPRGIRGVLLSSDGAPVAGQRVVSEDNGATTDAEGRFEVRWKDPTTFVDFRRGGVMWRRTWQPGVDSGEVTVQLPPVRDGEIVCRTELECRAEVKWSYPGGLAATTSVTCGERSPVASVSGLPVGTPEVRCSTILGDLALDIVEAQGRVTIRSKPPAVEVAIAGAPEGADCRVEILDGEVVDGISAVGLRAARPTHAWTVCNGRYGPPTSVDPAQRVAQGERATLSLPAAASGVDLVLDPPLTEPDVLALVLRARDGSVAWEQRIEPVAPGRYLLPPLPRGEYRLGWGAADVFAQVNPPDPEIPGTVVIAARPGVWGEVGGYVGSLRLEEDTPSGTLLIDGHPPTP